MSWIQPHKDGLVLIIKAVPRASRNEVAGQMGEALRIRLQAPPVEGKANKALCDFLSELLDVPPRQITLLSGETGRHKRVRVEGLTESEVRHRLSR